MTHLSRAAIAILASFLVTACGDDDSSPDPTPTGGDTQTDPFAGCEAGVLESDFMGQDAEGNPVPAAWAGPGVDPDTGELIDTGAELVVSSTYLKLQTEAAAQQRFGEAMGPIIPALMSNPGLLAVQLGTSMECATARTFTVWESEAAMMEFVTGDAHGAAVGAVTEISRGGSVVTSWKAVAPDIDWDEAVARIAADDGPFY